jgi:thioester reductase-like protein
VFPADIGVERFALSRNDWDYLANTTQAIVHMAAEVDFVKPYDSLRRVNVVGLLQALDLSRAGQQKRLLFVSSTSVVGAEVGKDVAIPESLVSRDWPRPHGGYDLSKWVCEAGLDPLFARGMPVKIFRLGEMMPPAQGAFNPRSLTTILLESCATVGAYPVIDMTFDWTPVDYFAKALVSSIDDPLFAPQVINFKSPVSVKFEELIQLSGFADRLEPLPVQIFIQRLYKAFKTMPTHPEIGRALSLLERQRHEPVNLVGARWKFVTTTAENQLDSLRLKWIRPSRAAHAHSFNHVFRTLELAGGRAHA